MTLTRLSISPSSCSRSRKPGGCLWVPSVGAYNLLLNAACPSIAQQRALPFVLSPGCPCTLQQRLRTERPSSKGMTFLGLHHHRSYGTLLATAYSIGGRVSTESIAYDSNLDRRSPCARAVVFRYIDSTIKSILQRMKQINFPTFPVPFTRTIHSPSNRSRDDHLESPFPPPPDTGSSPTADNVSSTFHPSKALRSNPSSKMTAKLLQEFKAGEYTLPHTCIDAALAHNVPRPSRTAQTQR